MSRSRTSLPGLLARQFLATKGPFLALAVGLFVISTVVAAAPLALRAVTSAEVQYNVDAMPTVLRDLLGSSSGGPKAAPTSEPFSDFTNQLEELASSAPDPLRMAFGSPEFVTSTDSLRTDGPKVKASKWELRVTFNLAPALATRIKLSKGSLPQRLSDVSVDSPLLESATQPGGPGELDDTHQNIEIVMSSLSAAKSNWAVGEVRWAFLDSGDQLRVRLSGTFDPLDPKNSLWGVAPYAIEPHIVYPGFGSPDPPKLTATGFVDPHSWSELIDQISPVGLTTSVGIPLSVQHLTTEQDTALLPQLRHFTSLTHPLSETGGRDTLAPVSLDSQIEPAISTGLERAAVATVMLAMTASGPIGVVIAGLWLLSQLVVLRRRDYLAVLSARGASGQQLRTFQASESLLFSLPAAILGMFAAYLLIPSPWSLTPLAMVLIAALIPPILIAVATSPQNLRRVRDDLGRGFGNRSRWVIEVAVLAMTALSVFLLYQRGLTTAATTTGVDPLLAATPLLLSISTGIIALRIYPPALHALSKWISPRKGIVAFIGASRGTRGGGATLALLIAMIVGLSVTVFSGVLAGTTSHAITVAAQSNVGADLRIDSAPLTQDQLDEISAIPSVEEAVGLFQNTRLMNLSVGANISVPVILADTDALRRVQELIPGAAHLDNDMSVSQSPDAPIPVILSPSLASKFSIGKDATLGEAEIKSGGDSGSSSSLSTTTDWVLVDRSNAEKLGIDRFTPRITLVKLEPDADIKVVKEAIHSIVGPSAAIATPQDGAEALRASPIAGGLQVALLALIVIVALLCAGTVVIALMLSGPARERLLALLRTLGLSRGQARGITGWEVGPTAIAAIVTGCILGAVLPLIVLAGVDLRPFTGGVLQPVITLDPVLLGIVVGGFALLVVVATAIAMAAARRVSLARTLRTSEEG